MLQPTTTLFAPTNPTENPTRILIAVHEFHGSEVTFENNRFQGREFADGSTKSWLADDMNILLREDNLFPRSTEVQIDFPYRNGVPMDSLPFDTKWIESREGKYDVVIVYHLDYIATKNSMPPPPREMATLMNAMKPLQVQGHDVRWSLSHELRFFI